ncbi:unnamed protein product [Ectocarpus sp. 13 AM-2016]
MLPSARRAELSRQYFDNSYLSRKAFEAGGAGAPTPEGVVLAPGAADAPASEPSQYNPHHHHHHHHHRRGGERDGTSKPFVKGGDSTMSKTTSGLTTFEDDLDIAFEGGGGHRAAAGASSGNPGRFSLPDGASAFKSTTDYGSEFSDDDESLGSMVSGNESLPVSHRSETGPDSVAGQIWRMLCSLDDLVLEVKANRCQCQRLGARLAALKKPMIAVHRGRQTADHAVLATIKDLVTEAQVFMERFLDPEWWSKGASRKEDSEMFRELTFRLGFLMQAPPGFQEQSQEEDHADRLQDYSDLQIILEEKLRVTKDERVARDIMEVLRRVSMRAASEGRFAASEIGFDRLQFFGERSLGNGGFGTVLGASLDGAPVAVKKLNNQNIRAELLEGLRRDVQDFHAMQYDFVVKTLGGCTVRPNVCIVQEQAATNLFDLLHRPDLSIPLTLPSPEKAAMLYDVARGLHFLHVKRMVHGNLKSTNVLVFENNRLKVSDFGLIALRESQSVLGGDTVGSAAWTAPEVLDDQNPSVLSDVYSFGVLVHEVLTQRVPFAGKNVAKVITAVVAKGHRPGYLENEEAQFPPGLTKLVDVCWTQDPAARPTSLNGIVTELGHILNALGGDPRPQPYTQTAGEAAPSMPMEQNPGRIPRVSMTEQERRIHDLEQELRALKMQKGADGGGGGGGGSRGGSGDAMTRQQQRVQQQPQQLQQPVSRRSSGVGHAMMFPNAGEGGGSEERKALRALYTATQGPGWYEQTGWETNDPNLSKWYGVVCGEGGRVTSLHLRSNNLQAGQLPRELGCLSRLKTLVLSDNKLEGPVPDMFGDLGRLAELDLSMNDLTGAIPAGLSRAVSLERLHLQCNGFTGNLPRSLQKLNHLKVFVVDWRELSVADTHPFRNFRKASPPPTQAEMDRALCESRTIARARTLMSARAAASPPAPTNLNQQQIPPGYPGAAAGLSHSNPGSSPQTPISSNGGGAPRGGGGGGGGRFKVMLRGGSSGSRNDTPSRQARARSAVEGPVPGAAYGDDGRGPGNSSDGGGQWMNAHHHQYPGAAAPYHAPTAPYRGEDGIQSKAKAKVEAEAPAPPRRWKNALSFAGKHLKDMVAVDLHPGFTDNTRRVNEQPPSRGNK